MIENRYNNRKTIYLLLIQSLIVVIFSIYMYTKVVLDAPVILFWIIFPSILILTSIIVLKAESHKCQMASLILLLFSIFALKLIGRLRTYQMVGTDDFFECGYANTIINTGHWDPTAGTGIAKNYYGFYPGIHLFLSSMSLVLNVDVFIVGKYIFIPLTTILQFLLIYLIVRRLFKNYKNGCHITAFIMLLYVSTIGFLIIHISRRTFADIFLLLALLSITPKNGGKRDLKYTLIFLISIITIIIGHHFSIYLSILIFGSLFLFSTVYKLKLASTQRIIFLIFIIILGLYFVYLVPRVFSGDFSYITALWRYFFGKGEGLSVTVMSQYNPLERILVYASQGFFILLSILGFIVLVKNHKLLNLSHTQKFFLMFFVISGLILYVLTGPLIRTIFFFIPISLMVFTGLGMSILFVISIFSFILGSNNSSVPQKENPKFRKRKLNILNRFQLLNFENDSNLNLKKLSSITFIIVIIFTGNIMITFSARYINRAQDEGLTLEDQRNLDDRFYASGLWLKSHALPEDRVVGDLLVFQLYAGYFSIDATQDWRIFTNETVLNTSVRSFSYVVFDKNVMKYPSTISGEPLEGETISKFDDNLKLNKVYDNRDIAIYHVRGG